MLEILVLWALTKKIGQIVEGKGRKSGWYKVMTVGLWFGGEIVGAIVGALLAGNADNSTCVIYGIALVGAAAGAGVSFLIANNLQDQNPPLPPQIPQSPLPPQS